MPTNNSIDADKYKKLKRFLIAAAIIAVVIIGFHLKFFVFRDGGETAFEQEIHEFTQRLFADEQKHNRYLAKINYQGKTKSYEQDDRAPQPLLQLYEDLLNSDTTSTTYLMRRLFDNYELDTRAVEHVTEQEAQEEYDFLLAVMKTPVMQHTMEFLNKKGYVSVDPKLQLKLLQDLWFLQYSRGRGSVGSSGFEHVFLAEIKDENTILGLHNWVYFYEQEKAGNLDYKGFIDRVDLGKDDQHLISHRSTFHGIQKPVNSLFVGTSPELELSLYTVCFVISPGEPCSVQLGTASFLITTHAWDWHGKKTIGTAYPTIVESPPPSQKFPKKRRSN